MDRATYGRRQECVLHKQEWAYSFEQKRYFGCNANEVVVPEVVLRVPEQLDERDQCPPRVGAMDEEALEENFRHDLPELIVLDLIEEV